MVSLTAPTSLAEPTLSASRQDGAAELAVQPAVGNTGQAACDKRTVQCQAGMCYLGNVSLPLIRLFVLNVDHSHTSVCFGIA